MVILVMIEVDVEETNELRLDEIMNERDVEFTN